MPFCRNCGAKLEEEVKFCPECGTAQEAIPSAATAAPTPEIPVIPVVPVAEVPEEPKSSGALNVGLLVWSILNLIFCCMPLGIPPLVMTIRAKDAATAAEEAKKLTAAKIWNLVGTIASVVLYVLFFAFGVIAEMLGE